MNRQPSSRARQHSLRPETVGAQAAGVLTFQLRVPLHAHKLLMLDLVEKAAVAVLVRHTKGHPDPPALIGPLLLPPASVRTCVKGRRAECRDMLHVDFTTASTVRPPRLF